jgi:hypothetical protein
MSEKKPRAVEEMKTFDPLERVVIDSMESGFFSSDKINMQRLIDNCRKRGLIGIWTQQSLSKPLALFVKASENMTSDDVDILLSSFAATIDFDVNLVRRHFYAILQGWEKQFLDDLEKENAEIDRFINEEMAEQ